MPRLEREVDKHMSAEPTGPINGIVRLDVDHATLLVKRWPSISEPAVPVFRDGSRLAIDGQPGEDRFNLIEIYDQTPGTSDYPLIWSDIVSNLYLRTTYQKPGGPGARLGTSVVGSASFRTAAGLQYLPDIHEAALQTGGPERIVSKISASFAGPTASLVSVRSFPDPMIERTDTGLSIRFQCHRDIILDNSQRGRDAFRLLTVASMFSDELCFDTNVVRYEDPFGRVEIVSLSDLSGRARYILPTGTELGGWFELVKEPGSIWYPDSPTIRIELVDRSRVPGRVGVQGYLADTRDPNGDSLSVWVEWLDAPQVIKAGTNLRLDVRVIATPPVAVF
jgi:hypothetical protein